MPAAPHSASRPVSNRSFWRDFSLSALVTGFVTVLVGYTSSAVIVFQAARALGASPQQIASWMGALGLGMGITCIVLSLRYRIPVVTAWSTPGAAMLMGSAAGLPLSDAVGAFVLSAILMACAGYSGWFEKIMGRIPMALASGMLAGVLLRFGLDAFVAVQTRPLLVLAMLLSYLLARRWLARYAVLLTLLAGVCVAAGQGLLHFETVQWQAVQPELVAPTWSWAAVFGIALPLFVVTMTSQNVPGVIVARAAGYTLPVSPVLGFVGVINTVLAVFGAYAMNLAAITAAICMGPQAHEDPQKRYVAAVMAGVFYLVAGVLGGAIVALLAAFPKELVMAIAGLALLGTIGSSLVTALQHEADREPALVAFLVTASGLSMAGVGAAFWGLVAGVLALGLRRA